MIISRSQTNNPLYSNATRIEREFSTNTIGIIYDKQLTFKGHVEETARKVSGKLAFLRRTSQLLDTRGMETPYKVQVWLYSSTPHSLVAVQHPNFSLL